MAQSAASSPARVASRIHLLVFLAGRVQQVLLCLLLRACAVLPHQELLRKHGLMSAYTQKLAAGTLDHTADAGRKGAVHTGTTSCMARVAAGLCCCTPQQAAVDAGAADASSVYRKLQSSRDAGPLRTVFSPVALLLLLAYTAATVFYLYTRAVRIPDLGPQWW